MNLDKTLTKILTTIPTTYAHSVAPCECRKTIVDALNAVRRWRDGELESRRQFNAFIRTVTACLPTPEYITSEPPKSPKSKAITMKATRLIVELQFTITDMIATRKRSIHKELIQRRNMIKQEWETELKHRTDLNNNKSICATG